VKGEAFYYALVYVEISKQERPHEPIVVAPLPILEAISLDTVELLEAL